MVLISPAEPTRVAPGQPLVVEVVERHYYGGGAGVTRAGIGVKT
jgi:hypothetical protein